MVAHTPATSRYVRAVLDSTTDLAVVADVPDYRGAVEQVFAFRPDVLVVEAIDNAVDAFEVTRLVVARSHPRPLPVLLLSDTEWDDLVRALFRGARGVVVGRDNEELLIDAVRMVANGYLVVPESLRVGALEVSAQQRFAGQPDPSALDRLTPRELDVVKLVASGCSNAEISSALQLSGSTVKSYVQRVLDKLGVRNRVGVVILAYRAGLLSSLTSPPLGASTPASARTTRRSVTPPTAPPTAPWTIARQR